MLRLSRLALPLTSRYLCNTKLRGISLNATSNPHQLSFQSLSRAARNQLEAINVRHQSIIDVSRLTPSVLGTLAGLPSRDFIVYPHFLSTEEQQILLKSSLAKLGGKRRRRQRTSRTIVPESPVCPNYTWADIFGADVDYDFEEGHFDGVIRGYREVTVSSWPDASPPELPRILLRLYELIDPSNILPDPGLTTPPNIQTHILHLASTGVILPHVDNVEASGSVIAGISLGDTRILRLSQSTTNSENASFDVLLESGSVYIQRLFTIIDLQQGELLIREEPLFIVPTRPGVNPSELIRSTVAALSPVDRTAFFALSYAKPNVSAPDIQFEIFQTNAISAGQRGTAVYSWRDAEGLLVVYAIRDIYKGQEILTTYTNTKRRRSERQAHLRAVYHFDCACSVCALPKEESATSDRRLGQMADAYSMFSMWGSDSIKGAEAIKVAKRIWSIGETEGYISERGQLAADAAHVAAAHRDPKAARQWATLANKWYGIELGTDSQQCKTAQTIIRSPESHSAWGTREPELVGGPEGLS
ncbi:unnamed protein product [Rhizoctonia solani]|uniref:Alpha-ketoglutarate-dependent dioxygenase AlkB-like domain-containing protein n=1 Tax=Rhizoctonia solani TaxID=456999 RepID=A0A8H2WKH9_9AGAM|nr:unnamed protein product [Rhizoctonia solani]